ncbi:MAG: HD domain-containing protein [Sumerlaeia bacterium]
MPDGRTFSQVLSELRDTHFARGSGYSRQEQRETFHGHLNTALRVELPGVADEAGLAQGGAAVISFAALANRRMVRWNAPMVAVLTAEPLPASAVRHAETVFQRRLREVRPLFFAVPELEQAFTASPALVLALAGAEELWGSETLTRRALAARENARERLRESLLREVLAEAAERKANAGATVFLLEPDLLASPGAVADGEALEDLTWILHGTKAMSALVSAGLIPRGQEMALLQATAALRDMRSVLHETIYAPGDQLKFTYQMRLSASLGYTDSESSLPEEQLMRDYFRHASAVDGALSRVRAKLTGEAPRSDAPLTYRGTGFPVRGKVLVLSEDEAPCPAGDRSWVMPLFAALGRFGLELDEASRERLEAATAAQANPAALATDENRRAFFAILNDCRQGARTLRLMHEIGFLERYLPEFALVRHLPRIDHYHQFALDEHMLRCVETAMALRDPVSALAGSHAAKICQEILRPDLLVFAALLHDTGKGEGRGHVFRGARLIEEAGLRIGLRSREIELLRALVLHHHRMSHIALKQDPDDPGVAEELADDIRHPELLRMLYVLTVCDIRSVSTVSWNEWRGSLLANLYENAAAVIRKRLGIEEPSDLRHSMVVRVLGAVRQTASGDNAPVPTLGGGDVVRFLGLLPEAYRVITPEPHVARHLALMNRLSPEQPVAWELRADEAAAGAAIVHLVAKDCSGLLYQVCCALAEADVEINAFHAFGTGTGEAVDVFHVSRPGDESETARRLSAAFEQVGRYIRGGSIPQWRPMDPSRREPISLSRLMARPIEVELAPHRGAERSTVVQVTAPTFPDFLRAVLSTLDQSQIQTLRGRFELDSYHAVLSLHVCDWEKNPLNLNQSGARLRDQLHEAVAPPRTINSSAAVPKLTF